MAFTGAVILIDTADIKAYKNNINEGIIYMNSTLKNRVMEVPEKKKYKKKLLSEV